MRTLYLDNSTLAAVQRCQTYAVMRYGLGRTAADEAAPLRAGTAVHEALATYLRRGDRLEALETFAATYRDWADGRVPPMDRLAYPNVAAILRYWLDTHPMASFPFVVPVGMVEVGAQALLTDEDTCLCGHPIRGHRDDFGCGSCTCPEATIIVFVARLDAAARGRDAAWRVVDHKTTGRISAEWLAQFDLDSQMSGYVWLLQQHLREPVVGAIINAIELSKVPTSTDTCKRHRLPYAECGITHVEHKIITVSRTPAQLVAWRKDALRAARQWVELTGLVASPADIGRVGQRGQWTGACPRCEMRSWCRGDRDPGMVEALFVLSPWQPFERVATAVAKGASPDAGTTQP